MALSDLMGAGDGGSGDAGGADGSGGGAAGGAGAGGEAAAGAAAASGDGAGGVGGAGGGAAGEGAGDAGKAGDHWLTGLTLSDETREWAGKKGYDKVENPSLVLESYYQLEKLKRVGDAELLRVPADPALDSEGMIELATKLGRPEKAELGEGGYQFPALEGVSDEDDMRPHFAKWSHDALLNNAQANLIMERFQAFATDVQEKSAEAFRMDEANAETQLRTLWGDAYDERMQAFRTGTKAAGLSGDEIDNMARVFEKDGSMRAIVMLSDFGRSISEARPGDGGSGSRGGDGKRTPAEAEAKAKELMDDPVWHKSWAAGNPDKIKQLLALNELASTGGR